MKAIRCPEPRCTVRGAHDIHRDGKGRSWAYRGLPERLGLVVR